jgi:hypothetical protein
MAFLLVRSFSTSTQPLPRDEVLLKFGTAGEKIEVDVIANAIKLD